MTEAWLYLRQSLDKTGDGLGVERQEAECRRLCKQRGWQVATVITDNSVSATSGSRPGYEQLVRGIRAGDIKTVVVLRVDRLLRRLTELEALIELAEKTGVQIATVEGDIDLGSSSGRLIARILASVARGEVETKSARHKLANAQKARLGLPHGSRRPFGYEPDLMTIREPEAALLRSVASKVIAGQSYKSVAYWLNEHGHTTTQRKPWYPITVRNLLAKKRYYGIREYESAEYPAAWQPIFDEETAARLRLTMKLRATRFDDRPAARKYLLTGLLFCGGCGMPLNGATKRDHPDRPLRRTYHCRVQGDTQRDRGCGGVVRNADALEHWIAECVLYRLDSPQMTEQLCTTRKDYLQHVENFQALNLARLRLDALVEDYASGLLNRQQFTRAKAVAEAALKDAEATLSRLQREAVHLDVPAGQTLREAYGKADNDWKRKLLELPVERVVVNKGLSKPFYVVDGKRMRFDPKLVDIYWHA